MKSLNKNLAIVIVQLFLLIFCITKAEAQTLAPGAPGKDAQWATAGKQAVGTSANLESKVWFTLAQGVMTEVYYPDVTVANVHLLQFVVVDPKTKKVETEQTDAIHTIKVLSPDSLSFQQINTAKSGAWKITKTYTTDPERNTVLIDVKFEPKNLKAEYQLYVFYDPSINNSGMNDTASVEGGLIAQDGNIASALIANNTFGDEKYLPRSQGTISNGFFGTSDALTELKNNKNGTYKEYLKAENGNVVQFAPISLRLGIDQNYFRETLYLGFGRNPQEALTNAQNSKIKGFQKSLAEYEKGWSDYVKTLRKVEPKYQAQFNMAAMQLKTLEDKTVRGANIASLTVPWGGGDNANENNIGGYHLIWSRDLYQVFTAYMALGDKAAAERALDFLLKVQQKPDGSFPQNSYLDGKPFWGSLQMDEVAYPLIMAYQLGRFDKATWGNHVKRAADFIVKTGPKTPQERWEEEGGHSPSTIAAEIAGLVCAAEIARKNGDETSANIYLKTADEWQANVEKWTVTTNGKLSKSPYYVRITQNGTPDAGDKIELNNGAGVFDERDIVDAGFLELVRLGIKSPDDPVIQNSVKVIDENIRVKTPNGDAFYRYNHDGYGEMDDGRRWNWDGKYTGKGRLWALLSGERGQFEIALCEKQNADFKKKNPDDERYENKQLACGMYAALRLDNMAKFANDGLMIPEQIWDSPTVPKNADRQFVPELKFGEGTGSATPLAWSMAQFIRLAVNLQEGRNLDTPDVVYNRYVLGKKDEPKIETNISKPGQVGLPLGIKNASEVLKTNSENITMGVPQPLPHTDFPKTLKANDSKEIKSPCEQSQNYRPKGNGTMTVPRKSDPSPRVFGRKDENESEVLFTYFGDEKAIEIAGDFTGWKPCGLKFQEFGDSKILVLKFPNSARVEYKIIVDGKWITDPLNPNKVDNGVGGENSVFTMPDYKPTVWDKQEIFIVKGATPEDKDEEAFVDPPMLNEFELNSKTYGSKKINVYLPRKYIESKTPFPVLYLQDGKEYFMKAKAAVQQENLVNAKKIKPFIIVFLDPKDRMKEYLANDDYAKFVAEEVVPAIDAKYNTIKSRDSRAIMGASLGGITSFHAAVKYPAIFGRIGGQSVSFWIDNERVVKELEKLDASKNKFTFFIDDGMLEGVEDSRKVVKILKDKGYAVTYLEGEAGHNWTAWRDRLAEAFIALWK